MTEQEARNLGLRALAAGYRDNPGLPVPYSTTRGPIGDLWHFPWEGRPWPDFRDAASRGVLLERVREAWGDPTLSTESTRHRNKSIYWTVGSWRDVGCGIPSGEEFDTEHEALVAALVAAAERLD